MMAQSRAQISAIFRASSLGMPRVAAARSTALRSTAKPGPRIEPASCIGPAISMHPNGVPTAASLLATAQASRTVASARDWPHARLSWLLESSEPLADGGSARSSRRLDFFVVALRVPFSRLVSRVLGIGTQGQSICPLLSHPACAPPAQVVL